MRQYCCFADDHGIDHSQSPTKEISVLKKASHRVSLAVPFFEREPECPPNPFLPDPAVESILRSLKEENDMSSFLSAMRVCKQFARIGLSLLPPRPKCPPLPDEILLEIFSAVRFNSSSYDPVSDLASSLRVSKQWYRAGMPLLYKNFVMDVNYRIALLQGQSYYSWDSFPIARDRYDFIPSARFYDTATKLWSQPWTDSGLGAWIYSLSVEIHFHDPKISQSHKHSITDAIKELPNIKTFSVRAAPLRQDNYILRSRFTDLIINMPSQIVNFELDLQSRDTTYDNPLIKGSELCRALVKLIPQLHTLRLRLATMCTNFLKELSKAGEDAARVCPNLRALSISLYTKEFTMMMACCAPVEFGAITPPSFRFMDALQARIENGILFPKLRVCSLICLRNDMSAPGTLSQRIICKNFDPRLRTWSKRAYFPCAEGFAQPWYCRTDAEGDESESVISGLTDRDFSIYNLPESLKIKHGRETDALFEGQAAWTEDAFGARYPPGV